MLGRWPIPPKDPKALAAWKNAALKDAVQRNQGIAKEYGSVEHFKRLMQAYTQQARLEIEVSKLREEIVTKDQLIKNQQELIDRLKDLLDIKTKECMLRMIHPD